MSKRSSSSEAIEPPMSAWSKDTDINGRPKEAKVHLTHFGLSLHLDIGGWSPGIRILWKKRAIWGVVPIRHNVSLQGA